MKINEHIKKLIELGVTKTAIANTIKVSRQLMDYRLEKNLNFDPVEEKRLLERYKLLLQ